MSYSLIFAPRAMEDFKRIKKSGDQARLKKLHAILEELREHPLTGIGNPERLRHRTDTYSRRLTGKDRIIYTVHDEVVEVNILQMLGHYGDK